MFEFCSYNFSETLNKKTSYTDKMWRSNCF